jgi:hypothetical protein
MTEQAAGRSEERLARRQRSRLLGFRKQLTPEELATRNAAETAKKIKEIFSRRDEKEAS